jgi:hypothetical protein
MVMVVCLFLYVSAGRQVYAKFTGWCTLPGDAGKADFAVKVHEFRGQFT